ncbi:CSS-motif domain-containing protein, partial [Chromobacterium piscinae]|uniref:CSS-motif domain-containing protein n=1 Tax=Chromobacterium piscinae TaxID=686831 RepID=UPI003D32A4E7
MFALLVAALPFAATVPALLWQERQDLQASVRQQVDQGLQLVDGILDQADEAARILLPLAGGSCDKAVYSLRRQVAVAPFVRLVFGLGRVLLAQVDLGRRRFDHRFGFRRRLRRGGGRDRRGHGRRRGRRGGPQLQRQRRRAGRRRGLQAAPQQQADHAGVEQRRGDEGPGTRRGGRLRLHCLLICLTVSATRLMPAWCRRSAI